MKWKGEITKYFDSKDKKMISQFCQIVTDCYWDVDRLFPDGEKVAILALGDKRKSLVSNKKMGLCL